jgi:hypothetical protein
MPVLSTLTYLQLEDCSLDSFALLLAKTPNLQQLELIFCRSKSLTTDELPPLPYLKSLLSYAFNFSNQVLEALLTKYNHIESFVFYECRFQSRREPLKLENTPPLLRVTKLQIGGNHQDSNRQKVELTELIKICPNLEELYIPEYLEAFTQLLDDSPPSLPKLQMVTATKEEINELRQKILDRYPHTLFQVRDW